MFGFSAKPAGGRTSAGFAGSYTVGFWWTTSNSDIGLTICRSLSFEVKTVWRWRDGRDDGLSVRCLRDVESFSDSLDLTFTAVYNTDYIQLDSIRVINRKKAAETLLVWPDTTLSLDEELLYSLGDELLHIGYTNALESGILDSPVADETYTFQFATNITCPGVPTITYEGQIYNTIQIADQCWLKENLNVGVMILGDQEMTDNGIIEKYCYVNDLDSCAKYGGLYQWNEMMQYTLQDGSRGICPPGWHLPSDEEWKLVEGAVDSQYGIGDPEWNHYYAWRGFDAGTNLKSTSGWSGNGNGTDLYGFAGLPGGIRWTNGNFGGIGFVGQWWTTTEDWINSWHRELNYFYPGIDRTSDIKEIGKSVRCLRD